ncbi:MAG: histidinol dehydrogenase [Bacteroidales bacterium]|jgi:histidinol dehydrogenase|nr:histidinol dehydrogenase [Bacteroidales bacterium]
MLLLSNPNREQWQEILARPTFENTELEQTVRSIVDDVKQRGDDALLHYGRKFDNPSLESLAVSEHEIAGAHTLVSQELQDAIQVAIRNITTFHERQEETPVVVETMYGVKCWRKNVAIEKVGLYIPGGTAPLFSTILMLAIPAKIAGCREIVLCTPEGKNGIHPAILYAAQQAGVTKIFKAGGAQAIAAMAYGTQSVPKVYKIFGPGNQFVTKAKMMVNTEGVAIDMPAGPSEVMVLADHSAHPEFIAADLLSQCEHGMDSQAILLTNSLEIARETQKQVDVQLQKLQRRELAESSAQNSKIIYFERMSDAVEMMNEYAPEHLILAVEEPFKFCKQVINAGSVFLGNYSSESTGDYASGTNHTLPTHGHAKAYSGVSLDSFVKKITFQEISEEGLLNIGSTVETMAAAEMLDAHKNAVSVRLAYVRKLQ